MNKRRRKKAAKKLADAAWRELVAFEPKGEEPCDDQKCQSCYVQDDAPSYF